MSCWTAVWLSLAVFHVERFAASARNAAEAMNGPVNARSSSGLIAQMQAELLKKGYSVGPAGAAGVFNDETLRALQAFEDNNALPVAPQCDRTCQAALGLGAPAR